MTPQSPQPYGDDAFDDVIQGGYHASGSYQPGPETAPGPYGTNPNTAHHQGKAGLTRRGRAVLAVGGTVLATGSLLGWQHYQAAQAANEVRAQELAIEQQKLDIERAKVVGKTNEAQQKAQAKAVSVRQKLIDACVQENKGLVGKQLGATYGSVLSDCQNQYPDTTGAGSDMQEAASASDSNGGGGGAGTGVLIGGSVLALGLILAVKKASASKAAPAQPYIVYPGQYPQR